MEYVKIGEQDAREFHRLAEAYYREGEDADTPQDGMDSFIRCLFEKVVSGEISGCFAKDGQETIGFALWAIDTEDFAFREMPGSGTILEIGLIPAYRAAGLGKRLVAYVEDRLLQNQIVQCYVSAYGPAQQFWSGCGYAETGTTAHNGLPIMVKSLR